MTIAALHHEMIRGLLQRGACPSNDELAATLGLTAPQVETLLRELSDVHGVVLHPHVCEPWIIHPFSITPTLNWIEGPTTSCWAPCIWCAFGVAALAGGEVLIHSKIAAESEAVSIHVENGEPVDHTDLWIHFAIPPSKAWANVHQHCSLVLPFHSPQHIEQWRQHYRQPKGQAVPIRQVAKLAKVWYGRHADPDWRKWTIAEAQRIFHDAGFNGPFWELGSPDRERF